MNSICRARRQRDETLVSNQKRAKPTNSASCQFRRLQLHSNHLVWSVSSVSNPHSRSLQPRKQVVMNLKTNARAKGELPNSSVSGTSPAIRQATPKCRTKSVTVVSVGNRQLWAGVEHRGVLGPRFDPQHQHQVCTWGPVLRILSPGTTPCLDFVSRCFCTAPNSPKVKDSVNLSVKHAELVYVGVFRYKGFGPGPQKEKS